MKNRYAISNFIPRIFHLTVRCRRNTSDFIGRLYPGGADISWGNHVTYNITKLNENEITLVQQGECWRNIRMFKRKGFVF